MRYLVLLFALLLPAVAQPVWPPRTFSAYYGEIESDTPQQLADFDLLILHPGDDETNLDAGKLARLRGAGRPKTLVGYVSIGEDAISPGGPPLLGQDGRGPSFVGKDLKVGLADKDYPAYFLDQRKLEFDESGFPAPGPSGRPLESKGQDGHPDENGVWGSYYVNASDPGWRDQVFQRLEHLDALGLDGFFLDTVDTASPWGDYGWTSVGMLDLVEQIRSRYPDKRIVANRGLFYLSQSDRYAKAVDAVLFESLLTGYREETRSASVNPWARWHVDALRNDVIPAQKRTGLALLVLDYLNPEHPDAPVLVQSARTLLQGTPQYSLSFSHPSLRVPGWPEESLLPETAPAAWPSVTSIEMVEEARGKFSIEVSFDGPIPDGALPDLRITERNDVAPDRAAELPLTWIMSYQGSGNRARITADGLDKATTYRLFFRLISRSRAPQSPYAWTSITTAPSELPAQVRELSSQSTPQGLSLHFQGTDPAGRYRISTLDALGRSTPLLEIASSPALIPGAPVDAPIELVVTAVDSLGREGYPSHPHVAVRRNVVPASPPGQVSVSKQGETTVFSWNEVPGAKSYRFYAIPEGESYRLPLVCKGPEVAVTGVRPGSYRVFATTVDKDGNQSRPGPSILWKAR